VERLVWRETAGRAHPCRSSHFQFFEFLFSIHCFAAVAPAAITNGAEITPDLAVGTWCLNGANSMLLIAAAMAVIEKT